jgi:phage-related protein
MKTLSPSLTAEIKSLTPTERIKFLQIKILDEVGSPIYFRLTDGATIVWRGENWINSPFLIVGFKQDSSGEVSRPKLNLPNPDGALTVYVSNRILEGAEVIEYRVMPDELVQETYTRRVFNLSHVVSLTEHMITAELRMPSDGNHIVFPPRRFAQPEFSSVRV